MTEEEKKIIKRDINPVTLMVYGPSGVRLIKQFEKWFNKKIQKLIKEKK